MQYPYFCNKIHIENLGYSTTDPSLYEFAKKLWFAEQGVASTDSLRARARYGFCTGERYRSRFISPPGYCCVLKSKQFLVLPTYIPRCTCALYRGLYAWCSLIFPNDRQFENSWFSWWILKKNGIVVVMFNPEIGFVRARKL